MNIVGNKPTLHISSTVMSGLGYMCSNMAWTIFNQFTPSLLHQRFDLDSFEIGQIMSLYNIILVILALWVGKFSDKTTGRFGKRIPLSAGFLFFIPLLNSFPMTLITIIFFCLSMALWRVPSLALTPDITPPELRSKANGIVHFVSGIGTVIAFLVSILVVFINNPYACPYGITAGLMLIPLVFMLRKMGEPSGLRYKISTGIALTPHEEALYKQYRNEIPETESDMEIKSGLFGRQIKNIRDLPSDKRRSLFFFFSAVFLWFFCFYGIHTFSSLALSEQFRVSEHYAARNSMFFTASFMIFSIPSGWLGHRIGCKKSIRIGLVGVATCFISLAFIHSLTWMVIMLIFAGAFWSLIIVNSMPLLLEFTDFRHFGSTIALHQIFAHGAAVLSLLILGYAHRLIGSYRPIYFVISFTCVIAFILMGFVNHQPPGEPF